MKNIQARGVIVPLVTPFKEDGALDEIGLRKLVEFLVGQGVHGVMPGGTTGEFALLTVEERQRLLELVLAAANGRLPVLAQTGAPSTAMTIALTRHAQCAGADAATVITPFFVKLSDEALIEHYVQVAHAVPDFPIFLYNIPHMAGNNITAPVVSAVRAQCPNAIGMKDSSGILNQVIELKEAGGKGFQMSLGADGLILAALSQGIVNASVSGNANACPEPFVELFEAYWRGDWPAARAAQDKIVLIRRVLKDGGDLSLFKAVLAHRGIPVGGVRPPLQNAPKPVVADGLRALAEAGITLTRA